MKLAERVPREWLEPIPGLFPESESFVEANAKAAASLFRRQWSGRKNGGMAQAAALMARAHPHAYQYIAQAPVLVAAARKGSRSWSKRALRDAATGFGKEIAPLPKLTDLMRRYGLAPQFRAIKAPAVTAGTVMVMTWMTKVLSPSEIAQAIPESATGQYTWLRCIDGWLHKARDFYWARNRLLVTPPSVLDSIMGGKDWPDFCRIAWAARAFSPGKVRGNFDVPLTVFVVQDLADFAFAPGVEFNPKWTLEQVVERSAEWHDLTSQGAGVTTEESGVVVDYGKFPLRDSVAGFDFVALNTPLMMVEEGRAMHHCVGGRNYIEAMLRGQVRLYSVQRAGERAATIEIQTLRNLYDPATPGWTLTQIRGPYNDAPPHGRPLPREVRDVAGVFVARLNNKLLGGHIRVIDAGHQPRPLMADGTPARFIIDDVE